MPTFTQTQTFNIDRNPVPLTKGDILTFKLKLASPPSTNNFTASITTGDLSVSSLSAATGYNTVGCPYLNSASIAANNNELVFSTGVSSFYGGDYIYVPNPLSGSISPLYDIYGDVDYPFIVKPYDIVLIYLSDGTYIESRVLQVKEPNSNGNKLSLVLDITLSKFVKEDLTNSGSPPHQYKRILLLSRIEDETNAFIVYSKRPGQTSYGFVIPQNIAPDVLANIDVITKEVKQKLITDQSVVDSINGGTFG